LIGNKKPPDERNICRKIDNRPGDELQGKDRRRSRVKLRKKKPPDKKEVINNRKIDKNIIEEYGIPKVRIKKPPDERKRDVRSGQDVRSDRCRLMIGGTDKQELYWLVVVIQEANDWLEKNEGKSWNSLMDTPWKFKWLHKMFMIRSMR
jgi:hypothetical protein